MTVSRFSKIISLLKFCNQLTDAKFLMSAKKAQILPRLGAELVEVYD